MKVQYVQSLFSILMWICKSFQDFVMLHSTATETKTFGALSNSIADLICILWLVLKTFILFWLKGDEESVKVAISELVFYDAYSVTCFA